jgi:hypothetical protein
MHCMTVFHWYSVNIHIVKNLSSTTTSKVATIYMRQIAILDKSNGLFDCDCRRVLYYDRMSGMPRKRILGFSLLFCEEHGWLDTAVLSWDGWLDTAVALHLGCTHGWLVLFPGKWFPMLARGEVVACCCLFHCSLLFHNDYSFYSSVLVLILCLNIICREQRCTYVLGKVNEQSTCWNGSVNNNSVQMSKIRKCLDTKVICTRASLASVILCRVWPWCDHSATSVATL